MTCDSKNVEVFYKTVRLFPSIKGDEINTVQFLEAAADLINLVERLGMVFSPVKYDMQGNIDKIKRRYDMDDCSCLFQLMSNEQNNGPPVMTEGVLWLNRAFLFFEIVFQEVIFALKEKKVDVSMKKIFTVAYEGSVKKYHNWVAQQLFSFICKMSPTLPQVMESFGCTQEIQDFEVFLVKFQERLHPVRNAIDNYFKRNHIF